MLLPSLLCARCCLLSLPSLLQWRILPLLLLLHLIPPALSAVSAMSFAQTRMTWSIVVICVAQCTQMKMLTMRREASVAKGFPDAHNPLYHATGIIPTSPGPCPYCLEQ